MKDNITVQNEYMIEQLERLIELNKKGLSNLKYNKGSFKDVTKKIEMAVGDGYLIEAYAIAEQYSEYIFWELFTNDGRRKYTKDESWGYRNILLLTTYLKNNNLISNAQLKTLKEFKDVRNILVHGVIFKEDILKLPHKEILNELPLRLIGTTNDIFESHSAYYLRTKDKQVKTRALFGIINYIFFVYAENFKRTRKIEKEVFRLIGEKILGISEK